MNILETGTSGVTGELTVGDTCVRPPQAASHKEDATSYTEFAEKHSTRIRGFARSALWESGCADPNGHSCEVESEVNFKVFRYWRHLDSPEHALYSITVNAARTHARKCRSEIALEIDEAGVPAFIPTAFDPTEMYEAAIYVEELLSQLGEVDRQLIFLRFLGYDFEQIAEKTGLPSNTLRSRYFRALHRLRKVTS